MFLRNQSKLRNKGRSNWQTNVFNIFNNSFRRLPRPSSQPEHRLNSRVWSPPGHSLWKKNVKNLETYKPGASIYQEIKILPLLRWENSNFSFSDSSPIFVILRCYWLLANSGYYPSFMLHSNISIPLVTRSGGSIFKMADEFEIHEGENGVICKIFCPIYLKHLYNAEGGDYIKFKNLC